MAKSSFNVRKESVLLPDLKGAMRPSPVVTNLAMISNRDKSSGFATSMSRNNKAVDFTSHLKDRSDSTMAGGRNSVIRKPSISTLDHRSPMRAKRSSEAQFKQYSKTPGRLAKKDSKLPALVSGSIKRSTELLNYDGNYVLEIDSQLYSSRQHNNRVGNFYNKVIQNRILRTNQPSPLLSPEKSAIMANFRKAALQGRSKSVIGAAHTEKELDFNDRVLMAESQIDNRDQYADILIPRMLKNMSQENLLDQQKLSVFHGDLSVMRQEISTVADNRNTAVDTNPQTRSKTGTAIDGDARNFSLAESMLNNSQLLDPKAGNSVITYLNAGLRNDVTRKIETVVENSVRDRERQLRRKVLAGPKAIELKTNAYRQMGALEDNDSAVNSEDFKTQTDSLADSSVYKLLADDMDEVQRFIETGRTEKQFNENVKKGNNIGINIVSKMNISFANETKQSELNEKKQNELMRNEPEVHFKKLKAKIKLKALKKFHEDVEEKKEAEFRSKQPTVIIKDKFGRIMEKKAPKLRRKRRISLNRKPVKRKPPQRLQSFTEIQLKFYGDQDIYNPMHGYPKPSLTDKYIIDMMKEADRFPIPEALLGLKRKKQEIPYSLRVDSLMSAAFTKQNVEEWAQQKPQLDAPQNSLESADDYPIHNSDDSDDIHTFPYIPKDKLRADPSLRDKQFDIRLLESMPYRMESMAYYPYRSREGDMPVKLLKVPRIQTLFDCSKQIELQQQGNLWDKKLIQNIFEHFCIEMKAAPFELSQFYNYDDPNNKKISIKNYQLDDMSTKALILILPYMCEFQELELYNNQITDAVSSALVFSFFCNPSLNKLTMAYNYMRQSFGRVLEKMIKMRPDKIIDLNVMGSINFADHLDPIIRGMPFIKSLHALNIAGCSLTQNSCRDLAKFVINCQTLRILDVSHCRVSYQSSRYLIDALNRNSCIRNFNFSHNDLTSSSYEFSIKIASMITRHPSLMHLNITNTNLKREELMFIGLSLPISKTLLSLHLTAQKLPYYERIFLRASIAARVGFQYRNATQRKKIQSNKERNQILQMASGEVQERPMQHYTENIKDLDEKRQGLDFEIQDLLAEMDTQASFEGVDPDQKHEELTKESKISILVDKLIERQKEIEAQQRALKQVYTNNNDDVKKELDALQGVQNLEKEMFELYGNPQNQQDIHKPEQQEDIFEKIKDLRVERQRIKAEIEVIKEQKDRSAGELALMFMGINQVAYELLVENPMTGYMNEIIFSRILGHEDVEEGYFWVDTVQCWICQKWDKQVFEFNESDKEVFVQNIEKVKQLQNKIDVCVDHGMSLEHAKQRKLLDDEIESVQLDDDISYIKEVPEELEGTLQGTTNRMTGTKQSYLQLNSANKLSSRQILSSQQNKNQPAGQTSSGNNLQQLSSRHLDIGGATPRSIIQQTNTLQNTNTQGTAAGTGDVTPKIITQSVDAVDQYQNNTYSGAEQVVVLIDDEASVSLDQKSDKTTGVPVPNPVNEEYDTTNSLEPKKFNRDMVQKVVFPENFESMNKLTYNQPKVSEIYGENQRRLDNLNANLDGFGQAARSVPGSAINEKNKITVTPLFRRGETMKNDYNTSQHTSQVQRQYIESREGQSFGDGAYSSVISHSESKRREKGQPVIIQRQIFFEGVVYMIEEELYSDSDHSSKYTSEDSFELDKELPRRFKRGQPFIENFEDQNESQIAKEGASPNVNVNRLGSVNESGTATSPAVDGKTVSFMENNSVSAFNEDGSIKPVSEVPKAAEDGKSADKSGDKLQTPQQKKTTKQPQQYTRENKALNAIEYYSNSVGLTEDQKDYESKIAPKYFQPQKAKRRLTHFEKKLQIKGQKNSTKEIYLVTSYNDWMPMRMKTALMLKLERYPMDYPLEDIPKQIYTLDNATNVCAAMVPPGQHFFYFVKEQGTIFLSPKYEIVRFKSTNIFLNRVKVSKRNEDIETVHQARDGEDDEAVFMKDRSVFKLYNEDSNKHLMKCFKEDLQFSKIIKTISKKMDVEVEFAAITDKLFENYVRIINIFDYYSGTSNNYPTISMNDFTSFAKQCKILDDSYINLSQLDLLLVATCVSNNEWINSAEKDLQRYEFVEMVVRLANFRYVEKGLVKTTVEGIERCLQELIYPRALNMDGENFRRYYCYNVKTNEILKKNEPLIRKVYDSFTHAKKRWIEMPECREYVLKMNLNVSQVMVGAIYAESMMTIIDTIRDQTRPNQMKFVEFIVFICRLAHEHYKGSAYHKELLYLKLDHLMSAFLGYLNITPTFLFGEKFSVNTEEEMKKQERRKTSIKIAKKRGETVDPKLLAEVKAYEDVNRATGMGSFHESQLEDENSLRASQSRNSLRASQSRGDLAANSSSRGNLQSQNSSVRDSKNENSAIPVLEIGQEENQNMDIINDLAAETPLYNSPMKEPKKNKKYPEIIITGEHQISTNLDIEQELVQENNKNNNDDTQPAPQN